MSYKKKKQKNSVVGQLKWKLGMTFRAIFKLPKKFKSLFQSLMSCQNKKILGENNEFGGKVSRYLDEKFVICSKNLFVFGGQALFDYLAVRLETGSKVDEICKRKEKVVLNVKKAVEVLKKYDRLSDNPDVILFEEAILKSLNQNGVLRLCVFVCPKFDTKYLLSKTPEKYMPIVAGPDLFEPRIAKIVFLQNDLLKCGLPSEINIIIGDNDAEEYIFPLMPNLRIDKTIYRERQNQYKKSFDLRAKNIFGANQTVWSLSDLSIVKTSAKPNISEESMQKEIKFFSWLFGESGPYAGMIFFGNEDLGTMVKMKYQLYASQGEFLEMLGGILLQTEGPGVWLERTQMLRSCGSRAVPAIYPWIRKDE